MRTWLILLGGLSVWAANFLGIYFAASIWPGTVTARVIALLLTVVAFAALALILARSRRMVRRSPNDAVAAFAGFVAIGGCAVAALAFVYHAVTAVLA